MKVLKFVKYTDLVIFWVALFYFGYLVRSHVSISILRPSIVLGLFLLVRICNISLLVRKSKSEAFALGLMGILILFLYLTAIKVLPVLSFKI